MKTSGQLKIQNHPETNSDEVVLHKLDKANLVINQFIRSCSHSMRGPLKSIRGLVNLLRDTNVRSDGDPTVLMAYMDESVDKMETMLDELEQFMVNSSKNEKRTAVDMKEVIAQSTASAQKDIKRTGIELSVDIEQLCPLYSDSARIRLILNHLLSNGIAFQKFQNIEKKIKINCVVAADRCVLTVEDNGIGIESHEHENIFNLFYRATHESQGAGIGLFIVREAVEKMGGTIAVDSEPGRGSVFTATLPNAKMRVLK